jgi:hypothetical protein
MSRGLGYYADLCEAIGLNPRTMTPMDIYLVAGNIIHDRPLTQLCLKRLQGSVLPGGVRLNVIEQLSPEEVAALRARVSKSVRK